MGFLLLVVNCALYGNHKTHKNMVCNTNFIKTKTVKLFNLNKISITRISVFMPLVVIHALKFILVKLKTVFPYDGIHTAIFGITIHLILKRKH